MSASSEKTIEVDFIKYNPVNTKNILVKFNTDKKIMKNKPVMFYEDDGWETIHDLNNTSKKIILILFLVCSEKPAINPTINHKFQIKNNNFNNVMEEITEPVSTKRTVVTRLFFDA